MYKKNQQPTAIIEVSKKPWHGPKQRAKEFLAYRDRVLPITDAVGVFQKILGDAFQHVKGIRFFDFIDYYGREKTLFRYTIALIWTGPNSKTRDAVYDLAGDIVRSSGWYPLPQGERLSSLQLERNFQKLHIPQAHNKPILNLGHGFRYIQSGVEPEGGCCIRVGCDDGAFLLDSGLPPAFTPSTSDRFLLLSHSHLDHSGGIVSGACNMLPTVMSTTTARLLTATGRVSPSWLEKNGLLLDSGQEIQIGEFRVSAFVTPHCPGSVGYAVSGENGTIIFPGDLTIKSARHNFIYRLKRLIKIFDPRLCTVFIDATMAGRPQGVTMSNTANRILGEFSRYSDIVIISNDVEHLLYAYLDLFHTVKDSKEARSTIEFLLSPKLRPVFEILHSSFITKKREELDPFVAAQIRGNSMSAWAESRWLYWLGPKTQLNKNMRFKQIWFVTSSDAQLITSREKTGLIYIGRVDSDTINRFTGERICDVDSSVWTAHSDEASICETARELSSCYSLVLFHNYPNRLKKFAASNNIQCTVLDHRQNFLWQ